MLRLPFSRIDHPITGNYGLCWGLGIAPSRSLSMTELEADPTLGDKRRAVVHQKSRVLN